MLDQPETGASSRGQRQLCVQCEMERKCVCGGVQWTYLKLLKSPESASSSAKPDKQTKSKNPKQKAKPNTKANSIRFGLTWLGSALPVATTACYPLYIFLSSALEQIKRKIRKSEFACKNVNSGTWERSWRDTPARRSARSRAEVAFRWLSLFVVRGNSFQILSICEQEKNSKEKTMGEVNTR